MVSSEQQPATKRELWLSGWLGICLLLAAMTLAVYWPVMRCDFVDYDDPAYFMFNPHVQTGLTLNNVVWSFGTTDTGNWHPLTWLSLMLDETLSGKSPAGPHFTNLLLHAANTVLLFLLFRSLTGSVWRSALVAALFSLHPLHVESVAWISERKDVLSTFFGLLALVFYTRYAQKKSGVEERMPGATTASLSLDYCLTMFFFALGLMSKPMLVTWPLMMLLLDWWPLQRFTIPGLRTTASHLILEKIPFFVLSAISCVVTFIVQQKEGSVVAWANLSMVGRVENAFVSYVRYLGKTFWPFGLANPYPHPGHWELWVVVLSMVLVVSLTVAAVWVGRKCPYAVTGWFWYLGTLVPVIGMVQVGIQSIADRYTYVSLTGVFIILAWGLCEASANRRLPWQLPAVTALLLLVACGLRTGNQLSYWRNSGTLFNHTLAVTGNNPAAYNALGCYLFRQGRATEATNYYLKSLQTQPDNPDVIFNLGNALTKLGDPNGAMNSYCRALQIKPDFPEALNNLGLVLATRKQFANAIGCFEKAVQLNPDYADAHNNLAMVLLSQQRYPEAIQQYRAVLRLLPNDPKVYRGLGDSLLKQGRLADASQCYRNILRFKPDDFDVLYNLGNTLTRLGDLDGAIDCYRRALRITPAQADILDNLGFALAAKKQYAEAITNFQAALKLNPDSAGTHNNLAAVLFIEHRFDEAARQYREASRLTPDDSRIYANLGDALVRLGQIPDAVKSYQEALRLKPGDPQIRAKLQALGAEVPK